MDYNYKDILPLLTFVAPPMNDDHHQATHSHRGRPDALSPVECQMFVLYEQIGQQEHRKLLLEGSILEL